MSPSSVEDPSVQDGNDAWHPRRNDHLVEPFFGGLEVERPGEEPIDSSRGSGPRSGGAGWWSRLIERLRRG